MKLREMIKSTVAILTLFVLVSGFQVDNQTEIIKAISTDEQVVYAGACNDNGCIGGDDRCMVVRILWGAFERVCYTTVKKDGPNELAQM